MTLRDYQQRAVDDVRAAFGTGARSVVLQLGTGAGKTHTASEGIIVPAVARGRRVLFLAHLDALITDTHARLEAAGVSAGIIQADRPTCADAPVQVASMQTLHARGTRPPADLVVVDECHHSQAASVRDILDAYPTAWLLGLTATPQRGDGRPLGDVFERLVIGPTNRVLTQRGHLAPCDLIAPAEPTDGKLAEDPVDAYEREAPNTRAIVFAANVEHASDLARRFNERGFPSAILTGETKRVERERLRAAVTDRSVKVLVGVAVFVEGFDLPSIETVILARGFTVTSAFLQGIGRGLRPSPATGKTRCLVIDLVGAVHAHGLPDEDRVWSLDGAAVRRAENHGASSMRQLLRDLPTNSTMSPLRCGVHHGGEDSPHPQPHREAREVERDADARAGRAVSGTARRRCWTTHAHARAPRRGMGTAPIPKALRPRPRGARMRRQTLEKKIQRDIEADIGAEPDLLLLRNSVGVARFFDEETGDERVVPYGLGKGSPDLVGILRCELLPSRSVGVWVCFEVKAPEGVVDAEQEACHRVWRSFGALVYVVRSVGDAREALARARRFEP